MPKTRIDFSISILKVVTRQLSMILQWCFSLLMSLHYLFIYSYLVLIYIYIYVYTHLYNKDI